jgi:hypothetical protein
LDGILALEHECDAHVSSDGNAVRACAIAPQLMKAIARQIHVFGPHGGVQSIEHPTDPISGGSWDSTVITSPKEPLQASMAEPSDHDV